MSDGTDPIAALKAKLNAFAKEVQPLLAAANTAKVSLIIMPTRIRVDTEGARTKPATPPAIQS